MMFHDLSDAFLELVQNCSHYHIGNTAHISFPEELWNRFEQEFNICFREEEDDAFFQQWKEPLDEEQHE